MKRLLILAVAGLALSSLGACASAARPEAMAVLPSTITAAMPTERGYNAIRVTEVSGGGETNPMWLSNVSNAEFKTALESSLASANLFNGAASAPMSLTASMIDLQRPMAGFDLTVTSRVRYSVTDTSGGIVFDDTIAASGTAGMGDSLMAVERLRMANEASIRENIKTFLERFRTHVAP